MTTVVCISDTHGAFQQVPAGDILIHCGDITTYGTPQELANFNVWLGGLPHRDKIVIAGNHDAVLAKQSIGFGQAVLTNAHYLCDSGIEVQGLKFYGAPWTPEFMGWHFMLPRGSWELEAHWAKIPEGLDVLMTHGPPAGKLDFSKYQKTGVGCELLRDAVMVKKPRYHCFGHLHESYGGQMGETTEFINCSLMDRRYRLVNEPIVLEIEPQ